VNRIYVITVLGGVVLSICGCGINAEVLALPKEGKTSVRIMKSEIFFEKY
jgi:hypothetical protein